MNDTGEECGRWDQNYPSGMGPNCRQAGTEYCMFDCPYARKKSEARTHGEGDRHD
jgi:hypothetical protein